MIAKDKVFVITGASAGIGSELAYQLAKKGANVVCAARTMTKLETVCKNIKDKGGSAIPIQADITNKDQCEKVIFQTIKTFNRIDGLVLNAGISMWAKFDKIENIINGEDNVILIDSPMKIDTLCFEKEIIQERRLSENPMTLEELSKKYKISRERIRQIETKAFEKLQKSMINAHNSKNLLPVN